MKNKVYIAGPMTGYPDYNYQAFIAAASQFRHKGFEVICPPELNEEEETLDNHPTYYLRKDIVKLLECNGIHLLDGWHESRGACVEAAIALTLGYDFFDIYTQIIPPPTRVICQPYPALR